MVCGCCCRGHPVHFHAFLACFLLVSYVPFHLVKFHQVPPSFSHSYCFPFLSHISAASLPAASQFVQFGWFAACLPFVCACCLMLSPTSMLPLLPWGATGPLPYCFHFLSTPAVRIALAAPLLSLVSFVSCLTCLQNLTKQFFLSVRHDRMQPNHPPSLEDLATVNGDFKRPWCI